MVPVLMAASMLEDPSRGSKTATNLLLNASSTRTGVSSSSDAMTPSLPLYSHCVCVFSREGRKHPASGGSLLLLLSFSSLAGLAFMHSFSFKCVFLQKRGSGQREGSCCCCVLPSHVHFLEGGGNQTE